MKLSGLLVRLLGLLVRLLGLWVRLPSLLVSLHGLLVRLPGLLVRFARSFGEVASNIYIIADIIVFTRQTDLGQAKRSAEPTP